MFTLSPKRREVSMLSMLGALGLFTLFTLAMTGTGCQATEDNRKAHEPKPGTFYGVVRDAQQREWEVELVDSMGTVRYWKTSSENAVRLMQRYVETTGGGTRPGYRVPNAAAFELWYVGTRSAPGMAHPQ